MISVLYSKRFLQTKLHVEDLLGRQKAGIQPVGPSQDELVSDVRHLREHLLAVVLKKNHLPSWKCSKVDGKGCFLRCSVSFHSEWIQDDSSHSGQSATQKVQFCCVVQRMPRTQQPSAKVLWSQQLRTAIPPGIRNFVPDNTESNNIKNQ